MMRHIALLMMLAVGIAGCESQAVREEKAVNAIIKLGGEVTRDEELPGRPIAAVGLNNTKVTDSDLKGLKELKGLQWLDISNTQITDAGLKELRELKGLRHLALQNTQITDAGLKELKGLQTLNLYGTHITDAGLKYLKELKGLQILNLSVTKITDAGLKDLMQALPEIEGSGP